MDDFRRFINLKNRFAFWPSQNNRRR